MEIKNFINNEWVSAQDRESISIQNPATGETYTTCPASKKIDVDAAVDSAKQAFPLWAQTSVEERSELLLKNCRRAAKSCG